MNATVYSEPHKLPAGVLALVVHSVFFALLYFGFNWNRQVLSHPMSVELWSSIPDETTAPPVNPKIVETAQPPLQEKAIEPDIAIPEKKKAVPKPVAPKPEKVKPVAKTVKPKPDLPKPVVQNPEAKRLADEQAAREQAERAKQDELAAANGRLVDEYKAKIMDKIRRNIVWRQQDASLDMRAEFMVTLLPGGSVLPPRLIKSSGNAAYDDAVERAILKSDPLPLPPDVSLFYRFREIDMTFKPEPEKSTE